MVRYTGLATCEVLHFCPEINFAMCLMMAALRPCVWESTWYALCRKSLKQNPIIYHRMQAFLGWLCTLCSEKLISSLLSLSFHSLSVEPFLNLYPLLFMAFFLRAVCCAHCC